MSLLTKRIHNAPALALSLILGGTLSISACNDGDECNLGASADTKVVIRDRSDLLALRNCKKIEGSVVIEDSDLTDLSGFEHVEDIVEGLSIQRNLKLQSLSGLTNLRSALGIRIVENPLINDLHGLENLRSLGESLSIVGNANLSSLDGLSRSFGCAEYDCIGISDNPKLSNCEAVDLCEDVGLGGLFSGNDESECSDSAATPYDG